MKNDIDQMFWVFMASFTVVLLLILWAGSASSEPELL
jgi:hypothetical protein